MPVSDTLADPVAEPNTWKATVLDPWVGDVSDAIAALEAGGGASAIAIDLLAEGVLSGASSDTTLATNNATIIQAALDSATSSAPVKLLFGPGVIPTDPLTLTPYTHWEGIGQDGTRLILVDGADTNFITSENFASLTGTRTSTGTCNDWSIRNLTIDGNGFNQTGTSSALRVYGAAYTMENVVVRQGRTYNFYQEYDDTPAFHSSGWTTVINNCNFIQSGGTNVVLDGPTDSFWSNCEVFIANDMSAGSATTDYLVHVKAGGSSTVFSSCHFTSTNVNVAMRLEAPILMDDACQVEGGSTQQIYLANNASRARINGRVFYHTTGQATKGVVLGNGTTDFPARVQINITTNNLESGSVDFTGDGGYSHIVVIGDQATGTTGWVGTPGAGTTASLAILAGSTKLALTKSPGRRIKDFGSTGDSPIIIASSASLALDQELVYIAPASNVTGVTLPAAAKIQGAVYHIINTANFTVGFATTDMYGGLTHTIAAYGQALISWNFGWLIVKMA